MLQVLILVYGIPITLFSLFQPFVVQSIGVDSLRRHHVDQNTMVTLHLFKNEDEIKRMMMDRKWTVGSR